MPLKTAEITLSGRVHRNTDFPTLVTTHALLPRLVQPTKNTQGVPAVMWIRLGNESFEAFQELSGEHIDEDEDTSVGDPKGSFVLKGVSPVCKHCCLRFTVFLLAQVRL